MTGIAMLPLATTRLILRAFRVDDAPVLAAYRNDPAIYRYQDWEIPVTVESVAAFLAQQSVTAGPRAAGWVQIAIEHDGELIGDVAVGLDGSGRQAMIGYTLRADRQGRGFAIEAVGAVMDGMFAAGVHRVAASLDPANIPSALLLERLGFRYEGRAAAAAYVRGTWEDDDRYAILRAERAAWLARPISSPADVRLIEIPPEHRGAVGCLATHHSQERFEAPTARSFADALVPEDVNGAPVVPWFRAVEADGEIVGFVMVAEATPVHSRPFLWRLLIDRRHQGRGIGRRVVELLVDQLRAGGHRELEVSWHTGRGGPEGFCRKLGFVPTGERIDGEITAVRSLVRRSPD